MERGGNEREHLSQLSWRKESYEFLFLSLINFKFLMYTFLGAHIISKEIPNDRRSYFKSNF